MTLVIEDLTVDKELDQKALRAIAGGYTPHPDDPYPPRWPRPLPWPPRQLEPKVISIQPVAYSSLFRF